MNAKVRALLKSESVRHKLTSFLADNIVTIMFIILCYAGYQISGLSPVFIVNDLVSRVGRNGVLILSLIIPVIAGMGLNFGIVLGAMAGQVAVIAVTHWGVTGIGGFLLCMLISTPIAILFGYLTGKLLNKTTGQEMITSMITGYFANGLYQLVFLVLVGTLIPMKNPDLMLSSGVGVKNTISLAGLSYAVDSLYQMPLPQAALVAAALLLLYTLMQAVRLRKRGLAWSRLILPGALAVVGAVWALVAIGSNSPLNMVRVPIVTFAFIAAVCAFITFIANTKLGQDFKAVGQDMQIAKVAGIDVQRIRIIAIIISMVLAAWGQLFALQNFGNLNTFAAHEQVGRFAIAALLIGGASVTKATIGQALLGAVLFHTLFVVSPQAGRELLGDAQLGEFFRSFVSYGVIAMALAMHAWQKAMASKRNT